MSELSSAQASGTDSLGKFDSFQVDLPWWRNRVDIYVDPKTKTGFVATVQLNRLGKIKNWQRHIGHNYTVLHVKGLKPDTLSGTSSNSSESMPEGNGKMSRPLPDMTNG